MNKARARVLAIDDVDASLRTAESVRNIFSEVAVNTRAVVGTWFVLKRPDAAARGA